MTTTVSELIELMGGPAGVEAVTSISANRVALWKHRKCIPRDAWPAILTNYPDKVTLKDLIEADPNKGRPTSLKKERAA